MGIQKIQNTILIFFIIFECGLSQNKTQEDWNEFVTPPDVGIAGGLETDDNEYPHMAALGYGTLENPTWLCGGSLISDQYVLTAAHCIGMSSEGPLKLVRLGTRNLKDSRQEEYQDIQIIETIQHPNYSAPSSYNDIALLKLQHKVPFSVSVKPACLHTNLNPTPDTLTALGWGRTGFVDPNSDLLLKVELRIIHPNKCHKNYRGATSKEKVPDGLNASTQLCAGDELEKDTCSGDSGGPLGYKDEQCHYVVGVTAFGKACALSKAPGVYTRVSAFTPWIESTVGLTFH